MSKKRLAASLLVVLFGILANILIFRYEPALSEKKVTVKVTLTSDEENYMEMFYLTDGQKMPDDFKAEQSSGVNYKKAGTEKILEYAVPADVSYLRFDLGSGASETTISGITIESNGKTAVIDQNVFSETVRLQEVKQNNASDSITLTAEKEDPYLVWNTENWGIAKLVKDSLWLQYLLVKILACVVLDIILIVALKAGKKLIVLPKEVYQNRKLLWNLSKNDFKTKFAGSYLGIIWAFIQPLVTIVLYWFVFQVGLRSGDIGDTPFILWLMAGLIPWFFFQEALVNATNCFAEYSYLVKKVVFNINILPVVKVVSSLFVHIFFMGLLIVAYILMGYFPGIIVIQLVYYSFCMIVLVLSISYFTSAISVFFKDTTQIINVFMQVGTWLTPILWNFYAPEFQKALGKLGIIFKLNPMFYIVDGCRGTMIEKRLFFEKPMLTLYFWLFVLVMSLISKFVYTRLKPHFADSL